MPFSPTVLTKEQTQTLSAFADRIVPPAPGVPSGAESGTAHVLRELTPGGAFASRLSAYASFLSDLNAAAGGDFAALSEAAQNELLTQAEANAQTAPVFRGLAEGITEGFYASPAGWDAVGFCPVDRREAQ